MSQPRILIVDDSRSLVRLVEGILQRQGYAVFTAFDGMEGLEQARALKPDLIILDIIMPKLDGYEVCRILQSDPATATIPVLMLTVKGQTEATPDEPMTEAKYGERIQERMEGFEAGALEFMSKPVTAKELVARVKAILWLKKIG